MRFVKTFALLLALTFAIVPLSEAARRITGRILDVDGKPIKKAEVHVQSLDAGRTWTSKTNKKGKFAINGYAGTEFRFTIKAEGYISLDETVTLAQIGPKKNVDFKMAPVQAAPAPGAVSAAPAEVPQGPDRKDYKEGLKLFRKGQYAESIPFFESYLAANPETYQVHLNIGESYFRMEQMDKAIEHFSKVLEQEENNEAALNQLGFIYLKQEKNKEAMSIFEKLAAVQPGNTSANFQLGVLHFSDNNAEKAIPYFEAATQGEEPLPEAFQQLGYAYMNQFETKKAAAAFEKYLEMRPNAPDAAIVQDNINFLKTQ